MTWCRKYRNIQISIQMKRRAYTALASHKFVTNKQPNYYQISHPLKLWPLTVFPSLESHAQRFIFFFCSLHFHSFFWQFQITSFVHNDNGKKHPPLISCNLIGAFVSCLHSCVLSFFTTIEQHQHLKRSMRCDNHHVILSFQRNAVRLCILSCILKSAFMVLYVHEMCKHENTMDGECGLNAHPVNEKLHQQSEVLIKLK